MIRSRCQSPKTNEELLFVCPTFDTQRTPFKMHCLKRLNTWPAKLHLITIQNMWRKMRLTLRLYHPSSPLVTTDKSIHNNYARVFHKKHLLMIF